MRVPTHARLGAGGRRSRAILLGFAVVAAILLAALEPGALPPRFRTCPFLWLTGLPCPFCGLTRAVHHLLRCDWATAWHLNPLAFPIGAAIVALGARALREAVTGRRLPPLAPPRAGWLLAIAALVLLHWILHIRGAVTAPKPELLRPHDGPASFW